MQLLFAIRKVVHDALGDILRKGPAPELPFLSFFRCLLLLILSARFRRRLTPLLLGLLLLIALVFFLFLLILLVFLFLVLLLFLLLLIGARSSALKRSSISGPPRL